MRTQFILISRESSILTHQSYRLWAGARIGGHDGRVVFDSWKPKGFSHIFDLSDEVGWKARIIEEGRNCQVWDVSCFNRAEGVLDLPLGKAVSPIEQWIALVKIAGIDHRFHSVFEANLPRSTMDGPTAWQKNLFN